MNELYTVNWTRTQDCYKDQLTKPTDPTDAGYDIHSAEDTLVLPYSHIPWEWDKFGLVKNLSPTVMDQITEINRQKTSQDIAAADWQVFKIEDDVVYRRKYKFKYIETGIRLQASQLQWFGIYPRSSCAKQGIAIANSLGVVDYLYSGSLKVSLYSLGDVTAIARGERIAQLIPRPQMRCQFLEVPEEHYEQALLNRTTRAGFGSSGTGIPIF